MAGAAEEDGGGGGGDDAATAGGVDGVDVLFGWVVGLSAAAGEVGSA